MRKYAARVDANQSAIVRTLEQFARVVDCSRIGGGHPDLEVQFRGQVYYAEIKMPGRKPNPLQAIWHADAARYGIKVYVLETEDDALAMLGARRAA